MPSREAIAIRGDRFVYVGSLEGAMALRGPATEVLDATGLTVLPGIVDAHLHLTRLGLDLSRVRLEDLDSYEELVAKVAAFARIVGGCVDPRRRLGSESLAGQRIPDATPR